MQTGKCSSKAHNVGQYSGLTLHCVEGASNSLTPLLLEYDFGVIVYSPSRTVPEPSNKTSRKNIKHANLTKSIE
jgi:hypothetical protein